MDLVPARGLTDEGYTVVYVYREVRRWKDENPGCVRPPVVEYACPDQKPDATARNNAVLSTLEHLRWRASVSGWRSNSGVDLAEHLDPFKPAEKTSPVPATDPTPDFEEQCSLASAVQVEDVKCLKQFIQDAFTSVIFWELWARTARVERLAATTGVVGQDGTKQREYRGRVHLAILERERVRDQRDQHARRQVQELTDRLIQAETGRLVALRRAQESEVQPRTFATVKAENLHTDATKGADMERVGVETLFTEKWQQRESEAEAARAQWAQATMASWQEEKKALKQRIQDANVERDRD
ncbi:hypothetical protein PI125_g21276 [Phytophthora idaei]|nr:hypothetical protein PI125_g21276 [Phytophthora idaei]